MAMGKDYMRDLLEKFPETKQNHPQPQAIKVEEVELNLGLSLGGCFGVKPRENGGLYRSSSNACVTARFSDVDLSLTRTSSLPVESGEESRKRKGLQSVRHMEGLKRRAEKERSFSFSFRDEIMAMGMGVPPSHQRSIGSQGSAASSGITDLENQSAQGSNNRNESRSPASVLSLPEQRQKPIQVPCPKPVKKLDISNESDMKPKVIIRCKTESDMKQMEEMPCVFTKGDGPNGKRIEGLLIKYKKGEEVRIVCVCHGSFLSPAEFVKHAGGSDVAHPLRHIVVVPSPSSSL